MPEICCSPLAASGTVVSSLAKSSTSGKCWHNDLAKICRKVDFPSTVLVVPSYKKGYIHMWLMCGNRRNRKHQAALLSYFTVNFSSQTVSLNRNSKNKLVRCQPKLPKITIIIKNCIRLWKALTSVRKLILKPVVLLPLGWPLFK